MVEGRMDEVLGCFSVPLDGRFTSVRTSESNLGNWVIFACFYKILSIAEL